MPTWSRNHLRRPRPRRRPGRYASGRRSQSDAASSAQGGV